MTVRVRNLQGGGQSVQTRFQDDFTRASGTLFTIDKQWIVGPQGRFTPITNPMGLADGIINANRLVVGCFGNGGLGMIQDVFLLPGNILNSTVWGRNQYAEARITLEGGVGSLTGPAVMMHPNNVIATCYAMQVRNGQWRLVRNSVWAGTVLIAFTAFVIPATLRIECRATGATQNTIDVFVGGVNVGTAVDNTGTIQGTGIPGIYGRADLASNTNWSSFDGGIL